MILYVCWRRGGAHGSAERSGYERIRSLATTPPKIQPEDPCAHLASDDRHHGYQGGENAKESVANLERWELRVRAYEKGHGESLPEKLKVAMMTAMCPSDVQDMVFQSNIDWKDGKPAREKVRGLMGNHLTAVDPNAMGTGRVG